VFVAEPSLTLRLARSIMSVSDRGDEVAAALEVGDILEPEVVLGAARAAHTHRECESMLKTLAEMKLVTDSTDYCKINIAFHNEVALLCENNVLRTVYSGLLELLLARDPRIKLLAGQHEEKLFRSRNEVHEAIALAIVNGDAVAAMKVIRNHSVRRRVSTT
jgi:DNA-binding FadR family transcriptional regulator